MYTNNSDMTRDITYMHSIVHVNCTLHTVQPDILVGILFGGLLEKGRKLQLADINLAITGSRGTITTPSPRVYAILADLILAV